MKLTNEEKKIKQKLFFKCNEFKPLLTANQYKVYARHIDYVIRKTREDATKRTKEAK